ncbi:MAG: hypothetical protein ABIP78_11315 [Pyrinomonadaceae bacterium]
MGIKGIFYLNLPAFRALDQPMAVELLLDKVRRVIGTIPAFQLKENAFIIKDHARSSTCKRISASAFASISGLRRAEPFYSTT